MASRGGGLLSNATGQDKNQNGPSQDLPKKRGNLRILRAKVIKVATLTARGRHLKTHYI